MRERGPAHCVETPRLWKQPRSCPPRQPTERRDTALARFRPPGRQPITRRPMRSASERPCVWRRAAFARATPPVVRPPLTQIVQQSLRVEVGVPVRPPVPPPARAHGAPAGWRDRVESPAENRPSLVETSPRSLELPLQKRNFAARRCQCRGSLDGRAAGPNQSPSLKCVSARLAHAAGSTGTTSVACVKSRFASSNRPTSSDARPR